MPSVEVISAAVTENNIKRVLSSLELSQEEAARRLGMSYRHFNRVALGIAKPTFMLVKKMEAVFGCDADRIFTVKVETRRTR